MEDSNKSGEAKQVPTKSQSISNTSLTRRLSPLNLMNAIKGKKDISLSPINSPLIRPSNDIEYNLSPTPTQRHASLKSSVLDATLNFANSIIGAGIIALPYAVSKAGMVLGFVLLVGMSLLVDWTVLLLMKAGKLTGQKTYQSIIGVSYGAWGRFFITCFQLMFGFGAMIAYVIIIGDTLPAVFEAVFGTSQSSFFFSRLGFILISTLVLFPLSLIDNIAKLSTTSAISMVSIVLIIISVIVSTSSVPQNMLGDPNAKILWVGPSPFKAIGVIAFAFVSHHSTFLIFDSLDVPTLDRFAKVTHFATLISLLLSLLTSYVGYSSFVEKTAGNILNNFPVNNGLINLARFCFAMNMFTTYPIECYVATHVLVDYFQTERRVVVVCILVVLSILIACFVPDVSLILQITGSFSASALAFILPPMLWLKLSRTYKWPCIFCIIFGVLVLILSLFF